MYTLYVYGFPKEEKVKEVITDSELEVKIAKVDMFGRATLEFNHPILKIYNTTLFNDTEDPILDINLMPSEDYDVAEITNWYIVYWEDNEIII